MGIVNQIINTNFKKSENKTKIIQFRLEMDKYERLKEILEKNQNYSISKYLEIMLRKQYKIKEDKK